MLGVTADSGEAATYERLESQIAWHEARAARDQRAYKWLKRVQLVTGASIPVVAGFDVPVLVAGLLGAAVVILEGFEQIGQYQRNWLDFRSTAEALKREKYLFLAGAAPYSGPDRGVRLAEHVEHVLARGTERWMAAQEDAAEDPGD